MRLTQKQRDIITVTETLLQTIVRIEHSHFTADDVGEMIVRLYEYTGNRPLEGLMSAAHMALRDYQDALRKAERDQEKRTAEAAGK